jgi:hypothetical protein
VRLVRGHDEWDVQLEGPLVRLDRPGAPSELVRAGSLEAARAAYRDAIDARLAEGYVEAPDPVIDRDARLVHADELQLRGDPAGELIAVHAELAGLRPDADPRQRRRIENRAAAILDEHHDAWFGALARHVRKPSRKSPPVPVLEVTWRLGFAEDARLRGTEALPIHEAYARLRELSLSRQILRFVVGPPDTSARPSGLLHPGYPNTAGPSYEALIDAMLHHGIPSRLRELVLGDDQVHRRPVLWLAHARAVVEAAPALEVLRIVGGHGDLALRSARLRVLELCDVTRDDLSRLAHAELADLEELVLRARDRLPPPAVFEVFPRLQRLTLEGFARAASGRQTLLEYLARAAPGSLRAVALPRCALEDRDLATVIEHPERFRALARLDLRHNRFARAAAAAAKRRVPALRVDP